MFHVMVFVKCIIICNSVRELDINGWLTGLHQFHIYQQPPRSTITVNKRMDSLELNMESCKLRDNMLIALCVRDKKLFHLWRYKIWLCRFM